MKASRIRRRLGATLGFGLAALLGGGGALAQAIDYNALETMFGEPVTTSAVGKPQRASDVPVTMDIITAEMIRRSGARSIPQVLQRYTTLDIAQYSAEDFGVAVRGYGVPLTPRLLVLVNGRQVYQDDYGRTTWQGIPVQLEEIRQIEVVRGPNSALFGFNAVGGVINIVTLNPLFDQQTSVVSRYGLGATREVSAMTSQPVNERFGVRLSAGLSQEHAYALGGTALERLDGARRDPRRSNLAGELAFRPDDRTVVSLEGTAGALRGNITNMLGEMAGSAQNSQSVRARVQHEAAIGVIDLNAYHNFLQVNTLTGSPYGTLPLRWIQDLTVVQASLLSRPWADHVLRPSFEYRRNDMRYNGLSSIGYSTMAAGFMWNWAVSEAVETTLAVRYDHLWLGASGMPAPLTDREYSRDYGTLAYNAGAVWRLAPEDTLRLSAARGIGTPSLLDGILSITSPPSAPVPFLVRGSSRLNPTVVDNFELGWDHRVAALEGSVGLAAFHQINRSVGGSLAVVPQLVFTPPSSVYVLQQPQNIGTSEISGIEAKASGKLPNNIDWGLSWRLAGVRSATTAASTINYDKVTPATITTARLGWQEGPLSADLFGRFVSGAADPRYVPGVGSHMERHQSYATGAGRLAYTVTQGVTLALEGENLAGARLWQTSMMKSERRLFASVRLDF